jgi:hypothetical protein
VSQRGIIFRKTFLKPSSTAESHDIVLHTEFQECMERMKHVMHILNQSPFGVEYNAARYASLSELHKQPMALFVTGLVISSRLGSQSVSSDPYFLFLPSHA